MTFRTVRTRSLSTCCLAVLCVSLAVLTAPLAGTAIAGDPSSSALRPTMVSVTFGGLHFVNDHMDNTYRMTPTVGLRLAKQMDERAEFFLGFQYGKDSGNPFDTPDFHAPKETKLKLVPITVGARLNATNNARYLFYFGLALRYLWMSEKEPWGNVWEDPEELEHSGWGWGLRFLIGPEWRDPTGRFAVGLEVSAGPQPVFIKRGGDDREVDLSGTDLRFYLSGLF